MILEKDLNNNEDIDSINLLIKEKIEKMYVGYNNYISAHDLPEDIKKELDDKIGEWESDIEPKINLLKDRQEALEILEKFIKELKEIIGGRFDVNFE